MTIACAGFAPHPPLLIPEVGGSDLKRIFKTQKALAKLAQIFKENEVETLVTISPHGVVFADYVNIIDEALLSGSLSGFGFADISIQAALDQKLIKTLKNKLSKKDIPLKFLDQKMAQRYRTKPELDHGVFIPLYYFQELSLKIPLVAINMGLLPLQELYQVGQSLGEVLEKYPQPLGVLASGDLSHRLTPNAPAGYSPRGQEFDTMIMDILAQADFEALLGLEPDLVEEAGECGLRPLIILGGILSQLKPQGNVLSYEGPFGVGYGVVSFELPPENPANLASRAVRHYLETKKVLSLATPLPKFYQKQRGVFVSLKDQRGQLRGCIGTISPQYENLAQEIVYNALEAAFKDPRFLPLKHHELDNISFSVDVLEQSELVEDLSELDSDKFGIIVEHQQRKGVLLPNIDGIDSAQEQLRIAKIKAGISENEDVRVEKFRVHRFMQD